MAKHRRIHANIILLWLLFTTNLETCLSAECDPGDSDGPEIHHFQCAFYYTQFENTIKNDRNELHWLRRNFFPEDGFSPSVMKMSVVITVGSIGEPLQTCTRNQEPTAFNSDGAQWVGRWSFRLSSSAILSVFTENDLLSFDNTITWAIHAIVTGIGGHGSVEHEVRLHIEKLFCNPSRDVITEVLTFFLSKIKHLATSEGTLANFDGKNKLYVSEKYHITDSKQHVEETSSLGWTLLLLFTFLLLTPLTMLVVIIYFKIIFFDVIVEEKPELYYSIYLGAAALAVCGNIINIGVFLIGLFYSHPALDSYSSKVIFSIKMIVTVIILAIVVFVTIKCFIQQMQQSKKFGTDSLTSILFHFLALVNLQLFLYCIIISMIPVGILLIAYPLKVLSSLAFTFAFIFCFAIIMSYIVFLDRNHKEINWKKVCLHALLIIFVFFMCLVIILYLLLQSKGFYADDILSFLLSLFPSGILLKIGFVLKKDLFKHMPGRQNPYALCL